MRGEVALAWVLTWLAVLPAAHAARTSEADAEARKLLEAQLAEIIREPAFTEAKTSVHVVRLDDGEVLFSHDAEQQLIPASNVKLVSTAAALRYLQPDYRFKTDVFATLDDNGRVAGDLFIKGYGDPHVTPERLWYLATRVYYAGVREIRGGVIVDDSYFEGPRLATGWEQDRSSFAYMAPMGAVSLGFNAILVHVLPGAAAGAPARVFIDPLSDYAKLEGQVDTVTKGRTNIEVDVTPERDRSVVRVHGRIHKKDSGRGFWRRIDNPPVFTGEVFKTMLAQLGVRVLGTVRTGAAPVDQTPFVSMASPRLAELIDRVNKNSNNFMAEQLAIALGAAVFGAPGTWEKGRKAIEHFLTSDVGLAPGSFALGNASGLHDVNRFTTKQLTQVLAYMYGQRRIRPEYLTSLAIAGGAGTLASRMRATEAEYMVRGKTGTLSNACALSGYATTRSGEVIAFSIIVNDYKMTIDEVWAAQDRIGSLLAATTFAGDAVRSLPVSAVGVGVGAAAAGEAATRETQP